VEIGVASRTANGDLTTTGDGGNATQVNEHSRRLNFCNKTLGMVRSALFLSFEFNSFNVWS
jgi:hypothetical protein